ncbi:hypothetical protein AAF712_013111 [Marasmius tenuissimus]|uniref:Uncharacterized protein n=1 Tax=Marasmius tenuissimus TaxID=585030 RepID=A0ABR2ZFW3_9AGAR
MPTTGSSSSRAAHVPIRVPEEKQQKATAKSNPVPNYQLDNITPANVPQPTHPLVVNQFSPELRLPLSPKPPQQPEPLMYTTMDG